MEKLKFIFSLFSIFVFFYSIFYPVSQELKLIFPLTVAIPLILIMVLNKIKPKEKKDVTKMLSFCFGFVYLIFSIFIIGFLKNNPFELIFIVSIFYAIALAVLGIKEMYYSGVIKLFNN